MHTMYHKYFKMLKGTKSCCADSEIVGLQDIGITKKKKRTVNPTFRSRQKSLLGH